MIRTLIKLHIGLFKFLRRELRKKRKPKEWVLLFKKIVEEYCKIIIKEYKNLFLILNADYRQQKKKFKQYNQIKTDLQRALKMLKYIDKKMAERGVNRHFRRQFWRDFFREGQVRKEIFEQLAKEII